MTTSDLPATPAVLNAREVAARYGVNERTVRRWVVSGALKADRVGRSFRIHDEDLTAFLRADRTATADSGQAADPTPELPAEHPPIADTPTADSGHATLIALVAEQANTISGLIAKAEAAAMWQARAELLAGELAAAREQVRALQAPAEEPETPDTVSPVSPADQVERPARTWWQRLLWGS